MAIGTFEMTYKFFAASTGIIYPLILTFLFLNEFGAEPNLGTINLDWCSSNHTKSKLTSANFSQDSKG
jgi:hypothetical protein